MKDLDSQLLNIVPCFDLRELAFQKLKAASENLDNLNYKDARRILGKTLHLPKIQSRLLLLQMSKDGMLRFDCKGRIFLKIGGYYDR